MSNPDLVPAIVRGLEYLAEEQRPDGGYRSFSSPAASQSRFQKTLAYETTFVPALILGALSNISTPLSRRIRQRLAHYIREQRSPHWSFNYWAKASPERNTQPYPDDLDDTACALIGLALHDPDSIDSSILAAVVKLLMATESQPGGPYRTWLVSPDSPPIWQDIDLAVNANIAYFLSLVATPLPQLTAFMEQAITDRKLRSPYYPSAFPILYYITRAYQEPKRPELLHILFKLRGPEGRRLSPLKQALLICAFMRLDAAKEAAALVPGLLAAQRPDGSWPAEAFCIDPARDGKTYYHGSDSLTTALALEALQAYASRKSVTSAKKSDAVASRNRAIKEKVLKIVRQDCSQLGPELSQHTLHFINCLINSTNGQEIVNLPHQFDAALPPRLSKQPVKQSLLIQLGAANLYGWTAYTIYDNFLDGEGKPELLSTANHALRRSLLLFQNSMPHDKPFQRFVQGAFDTIDSANAWEISNCRFACGEQHLTVGTLPDYGNLDKLAERSIGHTLPPLAFLKYRGFTLTSATFRHTQAALRHYIIAKQLNDDLHDWQEDLQNGHITYVVSSVLKDLQISEGSHAWDKLLPLARQQFWHESLPHLCREAAYHVTKSRFYLSKLKLREPTIITTRLNGIERSIEEALATQRQAGEFLRQYKQPSRP